MNSNRFPHDEPVTRSRAVEQLVAGKETFDGAG